MHNLHRGKARVAWRMPRAGWFLAMVGVSLAIASVNCRPISPPRVDPIVLRIGVALPQAVDPTIGLRGFLSSLTSESLVALGLDGRATQRLAEEWGPLADEHGMWLRLDGKLRFHDGSAVTAATVADVLRRAAGAQNRPLSYASITSIAAIDERTLAIRLRRPEAFLLSDLMETTIDGTGPYRLTVGVDRTDGARLEAFREYYRGEPRTDTLHVVPYTTQRNTWAAFMRGEIDAVHDVSPAAIDFIELESSVRTYSFLRPYYSFLAFNMRHPILARADVRQALSQAVNREEIVKLALRGRGQPADGPIWPFHWAYSTGQKTHSYNPDAARLRLDGAGLTAPTQRQSGRMPSRLRFKCLIWANDARFEAIALVMQKQLFEIGVDMEVEAVPIAEFLDRMKNGRYETLLMEFISGRTLGWLYSAFHSSHPNPNSPRMSYRAADGLLDRLRQATTDQEIRESVGQLQRTFYEDPPAIFIAWPFTSRAVSTAFAVPQESNFDVIGTIWQWSGQQSVARR